MKIITLKELRKKRATLPKQKYLWKGIKQKSIGLVFGPPKSGKTIFCENLAFAICAGKKKFLGEELKQENNKVLFIGLEEYWENRIDRNEKQILSFTEDEQEQIDNNFINQPLDFSTIIQTNQQWLSLKNLIIKSEAKTVFIDSITRMNHGKLEDSKTAEEIMQKLRTIANECKISLICIHHTPKLADVELIMRHIKGSTVFSQESDFALGINRTSKGHRYLKELFYRYADDNIETVMEIEVNQNLFFEFVSKVNETEILNRSDRRRQDNKRNKIISYFNSNPNKTFTKAELVTYFTEKLSIKDRMVENHLSLLVKDCKVSNPSRGIYTSINYNFISTGNAA